MRLFLMCLLMLALPSLCIVGWKEYEAYKLLPHKPDPNASLHWQNRGEVLFFNASWCGPCKQMKPIVAQLRREGYRLRDVDVDRDRELARKYQIRSVPTFVFVEHGREVSRFSGGTSVDRLKQLCASYH